MYKMQKILETIDSPVKTLVIGVMSAFIMFFLVIIPGEFLVIIPREKTYNEQIYMKIKTQITDLPFENLQDGKHTLINGQPIKIEQSFQYPDDKIIIYQGLVFSVENDNGRAKIVTAFDKRGNEISMP